MLQITWYQRLHRLRLSSANLIYWSAEEAAKSEDAAKAEEAKTAEVSNKAVEAGNGNGNDTLENKEDIET